MTQIFETGTGSVGAPKRPRAVVWAARLSVPALIAGMALVVTPPASAVPSFADQTGQPCQACHVGGFGPELTPFGREFKLGGYTLRTKASVPLAVAATASLTHTRKDQDPTTLPPGHSANDNLTVDQVNFFVAGGVGQHFGGFVQATYDAVGNTWGWDDLDLRAVTTGHVLGKDAVFGLTINNSPTVQDVWNTTPAWGYPFTSSALAPAPGASALIDGALAQEVLGFTAYTWIDYQFYAEGGIYTTPAARTLNRLGADPLGGVGDIHGLAPYGRLAWQHGLAGGTAEVGAFAFKADINPLRDRTSGYTDHYSDVGVDASWQKALASGNTISANLRYIHESSNLLASCELGMIGPGGDPNCAKTTLNEWNGMLGYSWHNKIGASLGAFSTFGTSNAALYAVNSGYATTSPNSNGVTGQLDYTPWSAGNSPLGIRANVRLGVQYTAYGKFNGAWHNYDGAGANAADNNTLRFFTWVAF